jgi:hypothetical protein
MIEMNARSRRLVAAGAGLAAAGAVYGLAVRPWHMRWGATPEEQTEPLPGDELVECATPTTHAITINAPPERVWPWLAQIGQQRGGFYSYTFLENLVGCHMKNAGRIEPEWQDLKAGDLVYFHPKAPWPARIVEANRALVLGDAEGKLFSWGFYLRPLGVDKTRLIVRSRGGQLPLGPLAAPAQYLFMEPIHFVMERKMMLTLKSLAEKAARSLK